MENNPFMFETTDQMNWLDLHRFDEQSAKEPNAGGSLVFVFSPFSGGIFVVYICDTDTLWQINIDPGR